MSGPAAQERKHGRTPNSATAGEWREYDDVPFADAPEMPKPPGRRKSWHPMVEAWWKTTSTLPHAVDWRPEDWQKVFELLYEKERYYNAGAREEKQTIAQLTEIRRREDALGIGQQARIQLRIRYKQKVEPGAAGDGPAGAREVVDDGAKPAGQVIPMKDRRATILSRGPGGGEAQVQAADTATG